MRRKENCSRTCEQRRDLVGRAYGIDRRMSTAASAYFSLLLAPVRDSKSGRIEHLWAGIQRSVLARLTAVSRKLTARTHFFFKRQLSEWDRWRPVKTNALPHRPIGRPESSDDISRHTARARSLASIVSERLLEIEGLTHFPRRF